MFTGIISQSIRVRSIKPTIDAGSKSNADESSRGGLRVVYDRPAKPLLGSDWAIGDSIALNGICSTISQLTAETCTVEYMPETCARTTVRQWQPGQMIHAEAPVTVQTKFSGGVVLGHVDTMGHVKQIDSADEDCGLTISFPEQYCRYVVPQGGITIDGVNLTIVKVAPTSCLIKLIPYTTTHTQLARAIIGQAVNIEFDYLAKITVQAAAAR